MASSLTFTRSAVSPWASSCLGTRCSRAMVCFSASVYPGSSITSMRSRSAAGIVESVFAVATKSTEERSKGTSM